MAMGLVQLLLAGIVMVINQKFFINGFKGLLARRAQHGHAGGPGLHAPAFVWSTYAALCHDPMLRSMAITNSSCTI